MKPMSPTPLENAEFSLAFTETNIRWLLGCDQEDPEIIRLLASNRARKKEIEEKIESLKNS